MKQWIIAIAVAVVFLALSLATGAWRWTWLIWVGYAVYRFAENRINSHREGDA